METIIPWLQAITRMAFFAAVFMIALIILLAVIKAAFGGEAEEQGKSN